MIVSHAEWWRLDTVLEHSPYEELGARWRVEHRQSASRRSPLTGERTRTSRTTRSPPNQTRRQEQPCPHRRRTPPDVPASVARSPHWSPHWSSLGCSASSRSRRRAPGVATKSLCDTIKDGDIGAPAPPQSTATTAAEAKKSLKLYKKFREVGYAEGRQEGACHHRLDAQGARERDTADRARLRRRRRRDRLREGFGEGLHVRPRQVRRRRHRGPPRATSTSPRPAVARTVVG